MRPSELQRTTVGCRLLNPDVDRLRVEAFNRGLAPSALIARLVEKWLENPSVIPLEQVTK